MPSHPLFPDVEYVADETGFVLYDRSDSEHASASKSIDVFGPYFVEQYLLMELLSKQEVAQNVLEYWVNRKEKLQQGLDSYDGTQGKGFVCWRFIMNDAVKAGDGDEGGTDFETLE